MQKNLLWHVLILACLALAGCGEAATSTSTTTDAPSPPIVGASIELPLSVTQGFNFSTNSQSKFGYLNALTIDGIQIPSDFVVTVPTSGTQTASLAVTGVLTYFAWAGGYVDPILLTAQISDANKNTLMPMKYTAKAGSVVTFLFTIYTYDAAAGSYYKSFYSASTLFGNLFNSGGSLVFSVAADQSLTVVSPKNYTFSLGVTPQPFYQTLSQASSSTSTSAYTKAWGATAPSN